MATLGSPGVQVTVIDESFYTPAAPGTVPLIFVATEQDKTNPSGGTAQGTTAANNGKVWLITSQRDLTDTFGTPLFYKDANGNAVHGSELNEYGLQAAYSVLGVTSRAYIARADVDMAELTPITSIPEGMPVNGTYWIDTGASSWGIFEWSATANSGRGAFTKKTPHVIDNSNNDDPMVFSGSPESSFGSKGEYCIVVTSDNDQNLRQAVYYKNSTNAWEVVQNGFDVAGAGTSTGKTVLLAPHTQYPNWTNTTPTGSVWVKTTSPASGANWVVKYYNGATSTWGTVPAPIYAGTNVAISKLDSTGGSSIPVGTLFVDTTSTSVAEFSVWRRANSGMTTVVSGATTAAQASTSSFYIRETLADGSWSPQAEVRISGHPTQPFAARIQTGISQPYSGTLYHINASYNTLTQKVTFVHELGGDFELKDSTNNPLSTIGLSSYNIFTKTGTENLYTAPSGDGYTWLASNWKPLVYEAKSTAPYTDPADGTLWYDANLSDVDIMIHDGTTWVGYRNVYPSADPMGPIISATEPIDGDRSDKGNLVDGDIWVSTANMENYGLDVYVYDGITAKWILQDVTDQSSPTGWLFADARWGNSGSTMHDEFISIGDLTTSDYVDPDSPDPALYPRGMRLWNLRRSGYSIKKYVKNYFDITGAVVNTRFGDEDMTGYVAERWVNVSGVNENGSGAFGRHAQRKYVVSKLKSFIDTNETIRDTDTLNFNLIATPGYPEAIANMVNLNTDRGQTAFVVGDTPFRLEPNASALAAWGNNAAEATDNGDSGAVTYDTYMGMFYPSGYTTDNSGANIVVPASHMMLRTIVNSDAKSYQWFAPAGTRRGGVDNASAVGYVTSEGEFQTVALHEGLRNVLHDVKVNPIATLPGVGLVNFGQYTRASAASALDRINVARLVAYLRRQLSILAKPFLFEPNDAQTRREIKGAVESLLLELVGQRALYDFIVVCDTTNNTAARIDRSELYVDIAIEPVKAVEFIYIPLRIKNTGEIAAGK